MTRRGLRTRRPSGGNREQTLAALPAIITGLHTQGYTLAALPPDGTG